MDKAGVIAEIRRTAAENGGKPLGMLRFQTETGIRLGDWRGKYWVRWGDALSEAGFRPNEFQQRLNEDELLSSFYQITKALGHVPVDAELRLAARQNPGLPSHNSWKRLGDKITRVRRLLEYCQARLDSADIVALCTSYLDSNQPKSDTPNGIVSSAGVEYGEVYLLKSGKFFKVGKSRSAGRRERELAIQLPEKSKVIHIIRTDDPTGIERYWHQRFADKRKNGEWFQLDAHDVAAFRRRKFM